MMILQTHIQKSVRPDLCYAVGYIQRFQQNPDEDLRYFGETDSYKLCYKRTLNSLNLIGYVDTD